MSKRKWYNNGITNKLFSEEDEIPPEFVLGVTPSKKDHLKKISGNNKGKLKSKETKKKMSLSAKNRFQNKLNHPRFKKQHSEETRQKISKAKKGTSAPNKGSQLTPEQLQKRDIKWIEEYGSLDAFYSSRTQKMKKTKEERYGNPNYINISKAKQTRDNNPNYYNERAEKTKNTIIQKYGSYKNLQQLRFEKIANNLNLNSVEEYLNLWKDIISKYKGKTTSSLENRIRIFLETNNINFKQQYLIKNEKYSHLFDFAIFENNCLTLLIDCDGLYYHGYLTDVNGKSVNNYSDDYRSLLVPEQVKFLIIEEGFENEKQGLLNIIRLLNIDYDKYLNDIYQWCREKEFPFPHYSDNLLFKSYDALLRSDPLKFTSKARFGEKVILNFHPSIYKAHKKNKRSPFEAWSDDILLKKCIKNRIIYKGSNLDRSKILNGFTISGIAPRVSIFNPYLAKYLISKYLNDYDTIFDPFSGYSGRLLGANSLNKYYVGFDINESTIKESLKLCSFLHLKNVELYNRNSLDFSGKYDCLLTCPPYSDKEMWNKDEIILSCDDWISKILVRYKCNRYVFIVDDTIKFKKFIKEEIINKSHFGENSEKIIVIDENQLSIEDEEQEEST